MVVWVEVCLVFFLSGDVSRNFSDGVLCGVYGFRVFGFGRWDMFWGFCL